MTVKYNDSDGQPHFFEVESAGPGVERVVHGVPAAVTSAISETSTATQALAAIISAGRLLVSEGSASAIKTAVEAVAALISAGKLAVVDAAAGTKLDTLATHLSSIITALAVPSAGPKAGYVGSIGTGADVSFASEALTAGLYIKNASTTGQILYYSHAAAPSSTTAYSLLPGEVSPFIRASNANAIKMRASAASGAAAFSGD
jgi:hypothetical protein